MATPVPTEDELKKFKVVELREKLSSAGLPTSGLKADLIERLHKHLVEESQQQQENDAQTKVEPEEAEEDEDLQRKVMLQQELLKREQEEADQRSRQQPLMFQPQSAPPMQEQGEDLMMKVREQQRMLEAENRLKEEADRRLKEAELLRRQQIALMEAKQEQRRAEEQAMPVMHGAPHMAPAPGLPVPPTSMQQQGPPGLPQVTMPGMSQALPPPGLPQPPVLPPPHPMTVSATPPMSAPPGLTHGAPPIQHLGGPPTTMPLGGPPTTMPLGGPPTTMPLGGPPTTMPLGGVSGSMSQPPGLPQQLPPRLPHTMPQGVPSAIQTSYSGPTPMQQPAPPGMQQGPVGMPPLGPPGLHQGMPPRSALPPQSVAQVPPQPGPPGTQPPGMMQPSASVPNTRPTLLPQQPGLLPAPSNAQNFTPMEQSSGPVRPSGPRQEGPPPPGTGQAPKPGTPSQDQDKDIKLPQALEKILAFKDVRAQQLGLTSEEVETMHRTENQSRHRDEELIGFEEEEEVEKMETTADLESKNKRRKKKKKKAKKNRFLQQQQQQSTPSTAPQSEEDVQVEYVPENFAMDPTDPNYFTFAKIFEAFKISEEDKSNRKEEDKKEEPRKEEVLFKEKAFMEESSDSDDDEKTTKKDDDDAPKMSKKKLKKMTRLSVAQLKQLVHRPDLVEMHDVTAQDPRLLVHLKATRNTVPVPRHWCFKRKYLQGKRGIEKPPFELPDYIKATGIMEMREALAEKEDQKTLKSKMREKIRPKMGKIDIDYQKLHDAFFRWQVKPKLTQHGDLYYEGKEFETRLKEKKPGNLSDELRTALGMPVGPNADKFPPPWLIAMQRYGPPPSYPNLKIPGLNAPIPENTSFGYHAGGWGKPPVDENGKPLYGDVFGTQTSDFSAPVVEEDIDKTLWGEMEEESSSEEESEEEEEEEEDMTGLITPGAEGLVTPSGITSVPMGVETPDMIELRKKRIEDTMDQGGETPALYTVLPEKKSSVGGAMMGSAHIYDMTAVTAGKKTGDKVSTEGIEVALNPEELDMDSAAMQAKYDQTMREQQSQLEKEDLSDMVAEHTAKQKKRKKQQQESGKAAKKYKEFKF